ncbi:MAG: chorismate synthase [Caldithrix sp. RBG_13_44_9]|nr:MAG: chorismate synthase [Caldithrix sp. RBG_13_44_9]
MSGNVFGSIFRVMTFGESHGPYIGMVIDGLQPGLAINVDEIQQELDRRRPGQSNLVTPRQETDRAEIVSGIFEGKTTGTPLCILIRNQDQRSLDYRNLKDLLRPGHASFTYLQKYGIFDYRGGGRASGRETATRVAAGAVAKQLLKQRDIHIFAYTKQIGDVVIDSVDFAEIEKNPVRSPDARAASKMAAAISQAQQQGDSLGGVIEIVVKNCPAGLGEPVFNKLDADLSQALMSIGAVKAFEVGGGFSAAHHTGSNFNDLFYYDSQSKKFHTQTNQAGGILGGISNGEDLVMRIAVKPPSSISKKQNTVDFSGKPAELEIKGRHDPCICPRVVPVAEAMVALVLIDHLLMQERISSLNDLENIRNKVDTIDTQIMLLYAQRRKLVGEIARIKKDKQLPVLDKTRETEKENKMQEMARELQIPSKLTTDLFHFILQDSYNIQEEIIQ